MDTIELVLPSTHPSPQPKWQINRFSRFCKDDRRVSLHFTIRRPFPLSKLPLPMGDLYPHLIHGSLAHLSPQPKWRLDRFSHFSRADWCDRPTNWPTDHATQSLTIGCIYARSTAMCRNNVRWAIGKYRDSITCKQYWPSTCLKSLLV